MTLDDDFGAVDNSARNGRINCGAVENNNYRTEGSQKVKDCGAVDGEPLTGALVRAGDHGRCTTHNRATEPWCTHLARYTLFPQTRHASERLPTG